MKLLALSWEYPPKVVGGIARVVHDLSEEMSLKGVENHILTCGDQDTPPYEVDGNTHVHRVIPYKIEGYDFIQWVYHLNLAMIEEAVKLFIDGKKFDLIHVHDWIVAYAGKVLKGVMNIPMVSTIHATEFGRNNGLHNNLQKYISNTEWWLTYESWKVIVNSRFMENQLTGFFQLPPDKLRIVPNGVRTEAFESEYPSPEFKRQYAADNEKIIFSIGRIVQEKGVHLLLDAVPTIASAYNDFKVVIAGKGPHLEHIKRLAAEKNIEKRVYFTGFIDDTTRNKLYRISDAAVFPSLYEPFGIVALEGMAAKVPVVASDTGGLRETIDHDRDGLKFQVGSADDLAHKLIYLLGNPDKSKQLIENGYKKVKSHYSWNHIADSVIGIYSEVLNHTNNSNINN